MKIDDDKVESDYNPLICKINLSWKNQVTSNQRRNQVFNFKSFEGQLKFYELTSESTILSQCFNSKKSFRFQTKQWQKSLMHLVLESLPTIINKKEKNLKTNLRVYQIRN